MLPGVWHGSLEQGWISTLADKLSRVWSKQWCSAASGKSAEIEHRNMEWSHVPLGQSQDSCVVILCAPTRPESGFSTMLQRNNEA